MAATDPLRAGRAAVVVVHGIGAQPPLATLGSLAQGLIDRARRRGERLEARPVLVRVAGVPRPVVRFEACGDDQGAGDGTERGGGAAEGGGAADDGGAVAGGRAADLGGFAVVDVYEFAWQGLVQGRATPRAVLAWLLRTGLAPLHVRRSWRVLVDAGANAPAAWAVVAWQALFASLLLLVVVALVAGLTVAVLQLPRAWPTVAQALPAAAGALGWRGALALALGIVPVAVALASLTGVVGDALEAAALRRASARAAETARHRPDRGRVDGADAVPWGGTYAGTARSWAFPALVVGSAFAGLGALAVAWARDAWSLVVEALLALAAAPGVLGGVLAALALAILARLLERVVGDIALYVTSDTSSAFHRSRHDVKAAARDLVVGLLRLGERRDAGAAPVGPPSDLPPYDAVLLVGHSLGSVIALDALNLVSREVRADDEAPTANGTLPLLKLRGLLTFGSPLDKVAYFFGERVGDGDAVHAQLLSFLHPTQRRPSRRDDGPYRLAPYQVPFGWLRWVHLHAPLDPVSDPLVFYRVDDRRVRPYPWPGTAHGRYWRDPVTYDALVELLGSAQRPAPVGGDARP